MDSFVKITSIIVIGFMIFLAGYCLYDFLNVYKETSVYTDTVENKHVAVHSKTKYDGEVYKSDEAQFW